MKMRFRRKCRSFVNRYILAFLIISSVIFMTVFMFLNTRKVFSAAARDRLEREVLAYINSSVSKKIAEDMVSYETLTDITKDSEDKVTAVTVNTANVNKIKSDITLDILKDLNSMETIDVKVPWGNFFGNEFLSGVGPSVTFKVVPSSKVTVDVRDRFYDTGINQTHHAIYLDVNVGISALMPSIAVSSEVKTSILITQTLIVGDVPDSYADVGEDDSYIFDVLK